MGRWPVRRGADLGAALAELRADRSRTQAAMAASVGLSADYLAKIEQGRTTPLLDHVVDALVRAGATIEVTWPDDTALGGDGDQGAE